MQIVSLGFVTGLLISWVSLVSAVDDWVLHVPAGKHSAEEVAKLHDLDNLGEVIPETNLFHFKQTSKRKKRSLEDLKEAFEANPAINAHIVQDKSLSRVKRVPLPEHPEEDQCDQMTQFDRNNEAEIFLTQPLKIKCARLCEF